MEILTTGYYVTRNGSKVTIEVLNGKGTFSIKGYVWKMFRGKYVPRTWSIWMPNGNYRPTTEHPLDIVGEWLEVSA